MIWLRIFLFFFLLGGSLSAQEMRSSLYYIEMGGTYLGQDSFVPIPTVGLGARWQKNQLGFDLCAQLASVLFINQAKLKSHLLLYPLINKGYPFYCGIGPEVGYFLDAVLMGQPFGGGTRSGGFVGVGEVCGYEFRHTPHLKTFIQLELHQKALPLSGEGKHRWHTEGAILFGLGF